MEEVRFLKAAPGMPTTSMERTIEHYGGMGFQATYRTEEFSILERDDVELHFSLRTDHDPKQTAAWIYVRVSDAKALHEELRAKGVNGVRELRATEYKMREFGHVDPDNNLLLFGSKVADGDTAE